MAVVSTRSTAFSTRHSSSIEPASVTVRLLRLKPVAILWARRGARQEVAGDLVDHEAVERLVAVEGGDDPVAPGPHGPGEVVLKAVGVGVAGAVEPVHRHPLAVVRRGEQAVDQCFVAPGCRSARNASTSSASGGSPIRSRVTRRIKRGPLGLRATARAPSASSRASTKRSIGFLVQLALLNRRRCRPGDRLEGPVLSSSPPDRSTS